MITALLSSMQLRTVGESTGKTTWTNVRIPQGSPLSTTIFNIFMDVLAESLVAVTISVSEISSNFFADDVILLARDGHGLHILLDVCEDRSSSYLMQWAPAKCIAIFYIRKLQPKEISINLYKCTASDQQRPLPKIINWRIRYKLGTGLKKSPCCVGQT